MPFGVKWQESTKWESSLGIKEKKLTKFYTYIFFFFFEEIIILLIIQCTLWPSKKFGVCVLPFKIQLENFLELLRIRAPFTVDNLSGLISYSDEIDFISADKYQINFRLL